MYRPRQRRSLFGALFAAATAAAAAAPAALLVGGVSLSPPPASVQVAVRDHPEGTLVELTSDQAQDVTWPALAPDDAFDGWALPTFEGRWVPAEDPEWAAHLDGQAHDLTEGLSLPLLGRTGPDRGLAVVFLDPLVPELRWSRAAGRLVASVSHRFRPELGRGRSRMLFAKTSGAPLDAAHVYRRHLERTGAFVSLATKVEQVPEAANLIGATHGYLHGLGPLTPRDVRNWPALLRSLRAPATEALIQAVSSFEPEARSVLAAEYGLGEFGRRAVAEALGRWVLGDSSAGEWPTPRAHHLIEALPGVFSPPSTWGGSRSATFLDALKAAGLDRLCLTLGALSGLAGRGDVAEHAHELGYLLGPYDSYNSIHPPDLAQTWETAQFGRAAYDQRFLTGADGKPLKGFMKKGRLLSPRGTQALVAARVEPMLAAARFNQWFIDCDAFGQYHDDFSPGREGTRTDDLEARNARMPWLSAAKGLDVGSAGGTALAAPVIHYAHGMLTPVLAWGDPDLYKDKTSPHFLGGWYPSHAPARLVKPVPLKATLRRIYFDPRYRLPLYQAVFHDSVVATHHWEFSSLKFQDQAATVALLEQLYSVPGLYHLSPDLLASHGEFLRGHHAFFSRWHRRTAGSRATDFEWLDPGRLVQRVRFGAAATFVANLSEQAFQRGDETFPPRSVTAWSRGFPEPDMYRVVGLPSS